MKHKIQKNNQNYLLLGSPNVGKSTFFNRITWKTEKVGNADRVTTFASTSHLRNNKLINVTDLPGVINLNPNGDDEQETFRHIFDCCYDGVINIVSANSLQRDLYLTYELAEAGVLSMIVVNMIDEVKSCSVNKLFLSKEFKVIIECISAKKNLNIKNAVLPLVNHSLKFTTKNLTYSDKLEQFISAFTPFLPANKINPRFIILQALQDNRYILNYLKQHALLETFKQFVKQHQINATDVQSIALTKDQLITKLIDKLYTPEQLRTQQMRHTSKFSNFMNYIFLNKWIAIPLFILIMAGIYFLTFYEYLGGWIQAQFADNALGALQTLITDNIVALNPDSSLQHWWAAFVGDGLIGGPFTILSFLPWVLILVGLITILEQIGLLTRMSIVFDNAFSKIGISGRALINLITGLGCNVPSIMMSRNANSVKERVVTSMLSPFISCSARVIVFGFLSQILVSTEYSWLVNLALSGFSIIFAMFIGYFFSNLLFRKSISIFTIELVKLRSPHVMFVLKKMVLEAYDFVKRTILIVLVANFIVWILLYTGPTSQFYINPSIDGGIDRSFLRYIAWPFQYLLYPIGLGQDWRFSVSLLAAFPAKEIAASNIEILFGGISGFQTAIQALPIGISLAYLMFFSFYVPCMVTIVILIKEIGRKYAWIDIGYGLLFSYLLAMFVYAIFGGFEMISLQGLNWIPLTVLVSLLLTTLLGFVVIHGIKLYKWKQATVWKISQYKAYQISMLTNAGLCVSLIIASSLCLSLSV